MTVNILMAPCCHDTIDLDPPETQYLMIRETMHIEGQRSVDQDGHECRLESRDVQVWVPRHVTCLQAGRGLKPGVEYDQIPVPGPLGTRRLARRDEL